MLPGVLLQGFASPSGDPVPLLLVAFAASTDFVDGILARRARPTAHGAILDVVADVSFVLAGTATAAAAGKLTWAVPIAIAAAVAAYALASAGLIRREQRFALARTRLGHAAGIANYAIVVGIALAVAWPSPAWNPAISVASAAVIGLNATAAIAQLAGRRA